MMELAPEKLENNLKAQTEATTAATVAAQETWSTFNPARQFNLLKAAFITTCLADVVHWAYLLRDDIDGPPNTWKFYMHVSAYDQYYLVARMFGDIFTCVLGLGAAMWTRKAVLTLPCLLVQLLFLLTRGLIWSMRVWRNTLRHVHITSENKIFLVLEFLLPAFWALLSILIVRTMRRLRSYEQLHGYAHPPVIVLTVKNDENDESVQIEIT